jgi:tight adherence protein C
MASFAVIAGAGLIFLGLITFVLVLQSLRTDEVAQRLHNYVTEAAIETRQMDALPSIRSKELSGSILTRTIVPAFKRIGKFVGRLTPASNMEELNRQLTIAGNPMGLGAREFYGIRLIFTLLGFVLAYAAIRKNFSLQGIILAGLVLIISSYLPKQWLKSRVRSRQNKIRKGLPDALDMLSVCADAGLGFDQSMLRVSEHWKTPVGEEFSRVISEMEMGISRQRALRNLSERLEVEELSSFVAVILQSDQLGMSIADTLHTQALQMREERRFRAQEEARKIPLKMLFPMLFFIFPAMMAVILGPVFPVISEMFNSIRMSIQ